MNKGLYKGCLEPILLKMLKEGKRMYGYEITQKLKDQTNGELAITEGALYPLLHRLEDEGILQVETEHIGNRIRKYYSLTKSGKKKEAAAFADIKAFTQMLNLIFNTKTA